MPRRLPASEAGQPVMDMTLSVTMTIESRVTKRESDGTAWIAMTFDDLVFGPLSMSGAGVPESGSPLAHGRVTATRDLAEEVQDLVTDLLAHAQHEHGTDDRGSILQLWALASETTE